MSVPPAGNPHKGFPNRSFLRIGLLFITCLFVFAELSMPFTLRPSAYPLRVGDVATQDILAPRSSNFTSQILTDQARKQAEDSVLPIYLDVDPGIARHQIELLRSTLYYISVVRYDGYASSSQKLSDFSSLAYIKLKQDFANQIISLNEVRWQDIQDEAINVLEQIMRNTIRDTQIKEYQRNVPTLINLSFPQEQASLINELVSPFIVPNSLYSEEQTQAARLDAGNSVQPIVRTFVAGESIVRRGQVITPIVDEALAQFDLVQPENTSNNTLAAIALVCVIGVFTALFFNRGILPMIDDFKSLMMIAFTFLLFLYAGRLIIPNRVVIPYLFPIPALGLTIASLFSVEIGLVFSLVLSVLTAYGLPNSLDLTLFYMLSSMCGILMLGKGRRIASYFWAGIAIGAAGSAVILAYRLTDTITDWIGIATLVGTSFLNGIASASLTLIFQFLFSQVLGVTTSLQLMEISRPDHPLLQFMLRNCPGTYQHSLQVANLAEQAAESIGADALLTRVGAIYHDAGKANNPGFFIENQVPGKIDTHDDIDPATTAATIIGHVTEGVRLARKYRLPPRIQDFIREHHGTQLTRYQYCRALEAAEKNNEVVDPELFRYPGPRPRSRETALLMLADGCEAKARAELPKDDSEINSVVKSVVDYCQKEGQLDDTTLTLKDLNKIVKSFVDTLRNTYHPRMKYPEIRNEAETENK